MLMFILAAAGDQVDSPPAQLALWQILVGVAGALTTVGIIGSALWWLIGAKVREFIWKVSETHKSLTVNGGKNSPPTMLDKVHDLSGKVEQLIVVSGANTQRSNDLADRMDDVHDIAEEARDLSKSTLDEFREHEQRGERYLGEVRVVLGRSGIELPPSD